MATYICCGCTQDMTVAVEQAFEKGDVIVEDYPDKLEGGDLMARRQVQCTCDQGHSCIYTENDG